MATLKESLLAQLDSALALYEKVDQLPAGESSQRYILQGEFAHSALAAVERATGTDSSRSSQGREQARRLGELSQSIFGYNAVLALVAIVQSVRNDVDAGYLDETTALIHAEVFDDLLEQGEYLLSEDYKDAAAVMCGGVLEAHLRNLCMKNNVDTTVTRGKDTVPKKADQMNADLVKAKAYSALEHKDVTAWLGLRNSAAHGQYADYDNQRVSLMIQGARAFMVRHPA